tara:strand:+ start:86 stop:295 length:210 start_codon:yes stop_codon:yes gene_type:complete
MAGSPTRPSACWQVIYSVDWGHGDGAQTYCREPYPSGMARTDLEAQVEREIETLKRREGGVFSAEIQRW